MIEDKSLIIKQKDILKDELEIADYYISSGAMNNLNEEEMYLFISRCFKNSQKGFLFNFLKSKTFNNVSQSEIIKHCRSLCNKLFISNNYLENDITIYLKKHPLD